MSFEKNTACPIPFTLIKASDGQVLTGATVTARRVLDGGSQSVCSGSVSELGNGQYLFSGLADDFNADYTIGFLFTASTAIPAHVLVQMSRFHKSTAYDIPFRLVNTSDGSALTGASPSGKRSIDGAAQENVGGSFSESGNGQYVYEAVAADFNGDKTVGFLFTATNAAPCHLIVDIEPVLVETGDTLRAKLCEILTADAMVNDPSYLGGLLEHTTTIPYGIYYQNPPAKPDLPLLTYSLLSEIKDSGSTEFNPRNLIFTFTAWGNNFDAILRRVFDLMQKRKEITASDYNLKAMLFDGSGPELWAEDLKCYYRQDRYQAIVAKI